MAAVELTVFQVILLFWSLRTAESQVMTLPGCESYCGDISIPYPFGMKEGCYLDERFKILCNSSSGVPKLTVNGTDLEVNNISVDDSTIAVMFPIVFANCSGKDGNTVVDLEGSPFVFSSENYFIARGCGNLALMNQNQSAIGGCVSLCDKNRDSMMASCSGIDCCQTRIPSFLKVFNVTMNGLGDGKGSSGEKQCRYAYLIDQSWIESWRYYYLGGNFDPYDMRHRDSVPVVLDWGIDERVFEPLFKNGSFYNSGYSYWCKKVNSSINSTDQSSTVQCSCYPGFVGNPYLYGYCQAGRAYDNYRRKIKAKMAGIGVGALFLLIGLWWLYKVFKRKRSEKLKKKNFFKRNGGLLLQEQLSSGEVNVEKIKMFPSKELDKATDHYNVNRTLGQGGQGTVYKGMLADGKIVAVKKSKEIDEGNLRQFINEVVLLSQINHRNVVKLLGCCLETELPLLIYEFIPNGTLFQFLHDPNEEFPLTWEMRLRIAAEVAEALFYLHSAASLPIFHRDIKSTNILLDKEYRAKVADFGTSRSVSIDQTHVTTLVQGTFGYLDPEYFQSSQFTDKSDVYSFGVVLVELLTGQKPISFTRSEEQGRSLATYFIMVLESNCLFDILDPQVVKQGKREDVLMVASLARSCLRLNGRKRPTMKEVTMALERIKKSENLIVEQENEYDRKEVMGAPWDVTSASTISSFDICAPSSIDEKPLFHTC
ncbi:wall-associated receptor kinase-like 1 isoform X7 [Populus trichocarpa]|uniref:wall-associated receptor kinase-like 1 isoform X7 n=1 Tax=Populus trichocarpa TaxID=3694 RepID=UPI0022793133|nr:wall-associated receptor kinase-like 1 isoform X7 [Populus trichocarpa]